MTDPASPLGDDEVVARAARLRSRRSDGRRGHPALGARIAATGLSVSALIAVFGGIVQGAVASAQPEPTPVPSSVVVEPTRAAPTPSTDPVAPTDLVTTREPVSLVAPPPTAPPPVARTNGSR